MNPAAFRVGRSWPGQVATGAPAQIRTADHTVAQQNAARIPGAAQAPTSSVATSGSGRRAPGQPIVTASTSQPAGTSSRGPVNPHPGHSRSSHAMPSSRRASSPARMERRTSEPVRPSSSRWTQVSGSARPRTPVSPVDMGIARPPRPPARPRPQSQRTPRFPDIAHDRVHRRRRGVVGILLVLVLAVAVGLGSWWLAVGRFVSAPAVIGLSEPQAVAAAHAAGLQINFTERPDEQVPSGTIITTDPAAGSRLPRNSQVHAALSTGPQTYPMPSVVGLDKDAAADALEASNLQLGGVDEQYDATHPQGTVIAASATTGTQVPGTQGVTLTVSKGPAPVQVTDFTGKSVSSAQAALTQTGLSVSITQQNSDTVASGQVISQNPAGGQLPPGSTVTFVVSSGPQQVAVPDVRARTTDDATKVLQDAGFTVQVTMVDPNSPIHLNRVQRSDPAQGTAAAKGTTVGIYII
ncbi:PASTA domain-containing protein [Propionibacterium sp.]|uniref:PASTA domain-containing protein n=1 Tax=Propionibacterium sp. TaxID=1977903 RepID=UPI0039ED6F41